MSIKAMLSELVALGMSQREISELVGCSQPTIYRALNGSEVRYDVGKSIEKTYSEKVACDSLGVGEAA
jgi:transposase